MQVYVIPAITVNNVRHRVYRVAYFEWYNASLEVMLRLCSALKTCV